MSKKRNKSLYAELWGDRLPHFKFQFMCNTCRASEKGLLCKECSTMIVCKYPCKRRHEELAFLTWDKIFTNQRRAAGLDITSEELKEQMWQEMQEEINEF